MPMSGSPIRNGALAVVTAALLLFLGACTTDDPSQDWAVTPSLSPGSEASESASEAESSTDKPSETTSSATTNDSASGIPASWYKKAKKAWPKSDGYKSDTPVITKSACKVTSELPEILGKQLLATKAGFGSYGTSTKTFKHLCSMTTSDNSLIGQLTYIYTPDLDTFYSSVESFNAMAGEDPNVTVKAAHVGGLDFTVSRVWDPDLKLGTTEAMYFSEETGEIAYFRIEGLNETQFKEQTVKKQAKALAKLFN